VHQEQLLPGRLELKDLQVLKDQLGFKVLKALLGFKALKVLQVYRGA
jgi:hypothetical protein